jgi:predicted dehydrogenase
MIRLAVVGLGKMGISHLAIANAHPDTEVVLCDNSGFVPNVVAKYSGLPVHRDYAEMLAGEKLDAVLIATPSRLHAPMVKAALERGLHVFCEKPFCLDWRESDALAELAAARNLVTQVGYHYRYVGAFREMKRIIESGALGTITHALAEAYGPVVLRPKGATWRTQRTEGGGCLYDYAAHPINILNWLFGEPSGVSGTILNSIFSAETDDEVYSTLHWDTGLSAHLSVNWSDESFRKMSTKITITGTNGRLTADRQECQLYLREAVDVLPGYTRGWNVHYTTELTEEVGFYLRGEEYSAQIEDFARAIQAGSGATVNDFASAAVTDRTIAMLLADRESAPTRSRAGPAVARKRNWFGRGK